MANIDDQREKAKLIKEALQIVDDLARLDLEEDEDEIDHLHEKARKLIRNRLWKLS